MPIGFNSRVPTAAKHAGQHVLFGLLLLQDDEIDIGKYEIEVTEFKSEVRFDLRGHLEATMASEATKMIVRGNMYMDTGAIEVADFKSEFKFDL